jgi:hypothetical protein
MVEGMVLSLSPSINIGLFDLTFRESMSWITLTPLSVKVVELEPLIAYFRTISFNEVYEPSPYEVYEPSPYEVYDPKDKT